MISLMKKPFFNQPNSTSEPEAERERGIMPIPIPKFPAIEDTTEPIENNPPSQSHVTTLEEVEKDNPVATSTFPNYYVRRNKTQKMPTLAQSLDQTTAISRKAENKNTEENSSPQSISNFLTYQKASSQYKSFLTTLNQTMIPKTVDETLKYAHWGEAIIKEMRTLVRNHT